MIAFLIISGLLLVLVSWILFVPFRFFIDTNVNSYYFEWSGIINVSFIPDEVEIFYIRIKVPFYHFDIFPIKKIIIEELNKEEKKAVSEKKNNEEPEKKKRRKIRRINKKEVKKLKLFSKLGWNVFKALKLKKLNVNIDTGDVIHNAWLIPVFIQFNGGNINLSVNYQGFVSVVALLEHSVFRILLILMKFLYHNRSEFKNL